MEPTRILPIILVLAAIGCTLGPSHAQSNPGKAAAIQALDEPTHDKIRFERVISSAKTYGVSEARITLARFFFLLLNGDLEGIKSQMGEYEKAFAVLPADEMSPGMQEVRQILPQFRKVIESKDLGKLQVLLTRHQRQFEAGQILRDLQIIDAAVDQCAIETNLKTGSVVTVREWIKYTRNGSRLKETGADIFGVAYGEQVVDQSPRPNPSSVEKVIQFVPPDFFNLKSKRK